MRKRNPRRRPTQGTLHPVIWAQQAFAVVDRLIDTLKTGEWDYTTEGNIPVIRHGDGTCSSMISALEGWLEFWTEVRGIYPFSASLEPVNVFLGYLKRDEEIPQSVIDDLAAATDALKRVYVKMPKKETAALARHFSARHQAA